MPIIAAIHDEERQLMLHQGMTITDVARLLCAARPSVGRWIHRFTLHGVEELKILRLGHILRRQVTDTLQLLLMLVQCSPKHFGWLRSHWNTVLLALIINRLFVVTLYLSTLHQYLKQADMV